MIFVNRYADYSAVAVGHIDVPVIPESETKAILAKYTKTITDAEKAALNNIVLRLKRNNIYDKLSLLAFPCFAGTMVEALTNIATDSASDYDATTHSVMTLKKYGVQTAVLGSATRMAATPFVDTEQKTMIVDWYQESVGTNICFGTNAFYSGANRFVFAPKVLGQTAGDAFQVGFNFEIMGCKGTNVTANNFFRYVNGAAETVTVDSSVEGTTITLSDSAYIGNSYKADGATFCGWNSQTAIVMIFNDDLDSTTIADLSSAIAAFNEVLAEVNE